MAKPPLSPQARRNRNLGAICAIGFLGMVGASFAAVPLYKAFCQLTGFDGVVRKADRAPDTILEKQLVIRFDTNVRELPWTFTAEQTRQSVRIGETGLAYFKVTNNGDTPMTGRALYNVVPESAGAYFQKLECFCFSDQTIGPGKTIEFPVVYFVDPKYADDFETKGKPEVTLSYTFFPSVDAEKASRRADASQAKVGSALGGHTTAGL
ncbi:MAG: cytochrome c oxidase assembly protein [Phenylobacterium sp.]|jgi:cytochrome c oxidase assembly protein subunit 11|uniref:Cytochrome c oxidase assembly protein CtaG n=1 Tax=Phenylobacterium ferrooxidans TaxID=2982689 RepID=A0ABW6CS63_9CAUL|nr:cytochrome c oxidase assembly protein [Phenylobacterium sp.]MDO8322992.1 cytochrome c oxidase assembly protein [Phenylobacterium sp.]MDO8912075.1 cytochrome c oxidase assembly protein [Phenylobacterium sp.]MDP2010538.1 cytochrome c oxidase assembly protein [Phenylobacterium sp.]MDP3100881.1 cytochrome c oxidase assembly protein [Phenylobacterium sp.]MDP3635023.1 cytochrome c oxidase assembly protein [Phenylobacterium sp.]